MLVDRPVAVKPLASGLRPPDMPRKARTESLADAQVAPGGAAAVDRALSLLGAFRAGDAALTLADLAQRTGLYKSTALRLLASLEHGRLVQRLDSGQYALGPEVARLHAVYAASFSLDRVVMPVLRQLVEATQESAAYHVRQGTARLCLYRVDSPQPIRDHIRAGDLLPMDRGAGARVILAFDRSLPPPTGTAARRTLAGVREKGYFAGVGDRAAEVAGISAPVFSADGQLAAALTLTMPAHRYDERQIQPVLAAARALSGQVG